VAELPLEEVHVWLCIPERADAASLEHCQGLLDEGERMRADRFRLEPRRRRFVASHALVRETLSRYAPVAAGSWRFHTVGRGRPEVASPLGTGLRFNLSHTDGLAACAVVRGCDIGVDVEVGARVGRHLPVAERFFSEREVRVLREVPEAARPGRFLDYWSLKEAYVKARGLGLALPLAGFSFVLGEGAPRIHFERDLDDSPEEWQFFLERPGEAQRLAVAVRRGARSNLSLRVRTMVPGSR
jgi:4'-phosphopantetheinyl transferase